LDRRGDPVGGRDRVAHRRRGRGRGGRARGRPVRRRAAGRGGRRPRRGALRRRGGGRRAPAQGGLRVAVLRVAVAGATGKTGGPVASGIDAADDLELVARVAPSLAGSGERAYGLLAEALADARPDVVVDFTRPDLVEGHSTLCIEAKVPLVLGTSGLTLEL